MNRLLRMLDRVKFDFPAFQRLAALCLLAMTCLGTARAAGVPDLWVFDEDDPLGADYYDASVGSVTPPSSLTLRASSRDKMPVLTNTAARGRHSGLIEWTSHPGGGWALHLFAPGFPILDLRRHSLLHLALNGPEPLTTLPRLELQDGRGRIARAEMEKFIPGGLDGESSGWQAVRIPLSAFQAPPVFDWSRVKHLTFRGAPEGGGPHRMWIDEIRFEGEARTTDTRPPTAPANLTGRSGDRSVSLHWEAVATASPVRYHIYRSEAVNGEYREIAGSPVSIQSAADCQVENGKTYLYRVSARNGAGEGERSAPVRLVPAAFESDAAFLEYLQGAAFDYFWYEADSQTGMIRDRSQPWSAASIAAIGFGLTATGIGIDHGWITREEGRTRALRTLRTLWHTRQGPDESGVSGHKGWFYHFLKMEDGTRFGSSELSSIDSSLLLAGIQYAAGYFDLAQRDEQEIRDLAERIYRRIDWKWMLNGGETLAMGWHPEQGFIQARWQGYNEASILYLQGIGAPGENRLEGSHWAHWTSTYRWITSHGYSFIPFAPLFGHQYSACWIDFRAVQDELTRSHGITYFENSRRATLAQRAYCMANPGGFAGYGQNVWGLTACDGPGSNGTHGYIARGAPPPENDDGTIAPTAAGGSLPFAPEECLRALRHFYDVYREKIWCGYGFRDAFNLGEDWWGPDVIGIDQGPILIMVENYRNGGVWNRMREDRNLTEGLKRAGFRPVGEGTRANQN